MLSLSLVHVPKQSGRILLFEDADGNRYLSRSDAERGNAIPTVAATGGDTKLRKTYRLANGSERVYTWSDRKGWDIESVKSYPTGDRTALAVEYNYQPSAVGIW